MIVDITIGIMMILMLEALFAPIRGIIEAWRGK